MNQKETLQWYAMMLEDLVKKTKLVSTSRDQYEKKFHEIQLAIIIKGLISDGGKRAVEALKIDTCVLKIEKGRPENLIKCYVCGREWHRDDIEETKFGSICLDCICEKLETGKGVMENG